MVRSIQKMPGMAPEKAEKRDLRKNLLGTAVGLTAVAGGAALANTKSVKNKIETIKTAFTEAAPEEAGKIRKAAAKAGEYAKTIKAAFIEAAPEEAGRIRKVAAKAGEYAGKAKGYIKDINPKVKAGAAIAAGLVAVHHFMDKGKIKSYYEGYDSANKNLDKVSETVGSILTSAFDKMGFQKKEQ